MSVQIDPLLPNPTRFPGSLVPEIFSLTLFALGRTFRGSAFFAPPLTPRPENPPHRTARPTEMSGPRVVKAAAKTIYAGGTGSQLMRWIHSETGPKTTHFWGPVANWGFVIAVSARPSRLAPVDAGPPSSSLRRHPRRRQTSDSSSSSFSPSSPRTESTPGIERPRDQGAEHDIAKDDLGPVHLQRPLHALRVGDRAPELDSPLVPLQQRVRSAESAPAVGNLGLPTGAGGEAASRVPRDRRPRQVNRIDIGFRAIVLVWKGDWIHTHRNKQFYSF